jgi:hypothetical protein
MDSHLMCIAASKCCCRRVVLFVRMDNVKRYVLRSCVARCGVSPESVDLLRKLSQAGHAR